MKLQTNKRELQSKLVTLSYKIKTLETQVFQFKEQEAIYLKDIG